MTFSVLLHHYPTDTTVAATASHYPSVGAIVPWASHDGGVLTQAVGDPAIGADGLDELTRRRADDTLAALLHRHGDDASRQIAVVERGGHAAHTGDATLRHAGHVTVETDALRAVCLGNVLTSPRVWQRMAEHVADHGDTADPAMLAAGALAAGRRAGGDLRGVIAAAVNVAEPGRPVWQVRVDDDPDPTARLPALLERARAYQLYQDAVQRWGRADDAADLLGHAAARDPDNLEIAAMRAAAQARAGQAAACEQTLSRVDRRRAQQLLRRVHESGWLPIPEEVRPPPTDEPDEDP